MGSHPLNLAFRFILELCALISVGFYGWNFTNNWHQYIFMILFPILLAAIWGIFNVPNDPSRSGKAPIPVSGIIRLLLEIGIFIVATWSLHAMEFNRLYIVYAVLIVIHYALSYDRIKWLLEQ